jgi:long-chain acyl-CoA synthetase
MRTSVVSYLDEFISRGRDIAFAHRRNLRVARWSYERTARTAYRFARELEARGVGKGDRVLLWAENSPEWVAVFFGCLLRGAIVVPLDVKSDLAFIARIQAQVQAKLLVCEAESPSTIQLGLPALAVEEIDSTISHHSGEPHSATAIHSDDLLEIIFTSGTTAEPKGVSLTHRNLLANLSPLEDEIKRYRKWERLVHPVRFLNLVPLSHVFGQFMGMLVPQLLGGEVFFQDSLNASQIIDTAKRERISVIVVVPRILDSLRDKIERVYAAHGELEQFTKDLQTSKRRHFIFRWWKFRRAHRLLGWKFWAFVCGGATLDQETENFWHRLGFAVIQGYGMTETAALVAVNHPFKTARGSIGQALRGHRVELADDGEILVRGPSVSPGYWSGEEESVARGGDDWLHTGDIGDKDEQGNIYFKGRKKEVIVTAAGLNIYPGDIEAVLNRQPEIKESAVIQLEGPHGSEPVAVLFLRDEVADLWEVINRANESLAPHQRVRRWFVWPGEDFPRTPTQKIRKQIVADSVRAHLAGTPLSAAMPEGSVGDIIKQISRDPIVNLNPTAKLGIDLRLDSLARVELLSALEDRYQVEIDEAALTDATTLADVEKIVREQRGQVSPYPYPRWQQKWPVSWLRIALLYGIAFTAIRLLGWPRVRGKEHLNRLKGPTVFVSNHVTMLDHALILFALPARFKTRTAIAQDGEVLREWRHASKSTGVFRRLLNLAEYFLVVLFFNVFSLPQKSGFRQSFRFAGELMDRGYSLMIFPEGERTKHGRMNPFRVGAGLLIKELPAPVVPVRIDGLWKFKQANRHFAWPGQISVNIGKPVRYSRQEAPDKIARDLEQRVKAI